jgi:hypothetical protein
MFKRQDNQARDKQVHPRPSPVPAGTKEYPAVVYLGTDAHKIVRNEKEENDATAAGWSRTAPNPNAPAKPKPVAPVVVVNPTAPKV